MLSFSQLITEYKQLKNKEQDDFLKNNFYSSRAHPVQIDNCETDAVALLVNLANKLKPDPVYCHETAQTALANDKFLTTALACTKGLISHSIKYSDAKFAGGFLNLSPPQSSTEQDFVHSATTRLVKPLDWTGNAADLSNKILFCTAFYWQQQILTLTEAVAKAIPEFTQALLALGLDNQQVEKITQICQQAIQPKYPEGNSFKTLYFPRRSSKKANDYLLVTPLPNVAFQRELYSRTQNDKLPEGTYLRKRRHKVGETKPVNVGDFYGSISGFVTVLDGGFFAATSSLHDRSLHWFLAGKAYWPPLPKAKKAADSAKIAKYPELFAFLNQVHFAEGLRANQIQHLENGFKNLLVNHFFAAHLEWAKLADQQLITPQSDTLSEQHYIVFGQLSDEIAKQRFIQLVQNRIARMLEGGLSTVQQTALTTALNAVIELRFGGKV